MNHTNSHQPILIENMKKPQKKKIYKILQYNAKKKHLILVGKKLPFFYLYS